MKRATSIVFLGCGCLLMAATRVSAQKAADAAKKQASEITLRREARIAETDARKTALAEVPGGRIQSHALERENGKLIYSYDIRVVGKSGIEEVNVDAITGRIVAHEHEDARAEARERKAEARETKKP
jgi:uncharacterized membrane protein YkoI